MKELIFKEDAVRSVADSAYYFLDSEGKGVDMKDKRKVAKKMLENAKPVKETPWIKRGKMQFLCTNCKETFHKIDIDVYRHCPFCSMPHKGFEVSDDE